MYLIFNYFPILNHWTTMDTIRYIRTIINHWNIIYSNTYTGWYVILQSDVDKVMYMSTWVHTRFFYGVHVYNFLDCVYVFFFLFVLVLCLVCPNIIFGNKLPQKEYIQFIILLTSLTDIGDTVTVVDLFLRRLDSIKDK
jgi:3'-phosphoadenosine 5'-phosphosulfate sulfotransferase (PAPS reductase)/FAD synthetase